MTRSDAELRRNCVYRDISAVSYAPVEPDTVNFSITVGNVEELVELECDCSGKKTIFIFDEKSQQIPIALDGPIFGSWSNDLKRKVTELLAELAKWEASMREPKGAWDARVLAGQTNDLEDDVSES